MAVLREDDVSLSVTILVAERRLLKVWPAVRLIAALVVALVVIVLENEGLELTHVVDVTVIVEQAEGNDEGEWVIVTVAVRVKKWGDGEGEVEPVTVTVAACDALAEVLLVNDKNVPEDVGESVPPSPVFEPERVEVTLGEKVEAIEREVDGDELDELVPVELFDVVTDADTLTVTIDDML